MAPLRRRRDRRGSGSRNRRRRRAGTRRRPRAAAPRWPRLRRRPEHPPRLGPAGTAGHGGRSPHPVVVAVASSARVPPAPDEAIPTPPAYGRHDGRVSRWIFHMDLDQFIAAVELLRRPELAGKPVVVGGDGDPTKRGVVSTASYEAREFGIKSAMPLRTAFKRCPDAVFLPVDAEAYLAASRTVMDTLRRFPAVVQEAGWDEAFLAAESDDPEALAREIQRSVLERTKLWCSIGVGDSKLRAKMASGFAKPRGVFRLTRDNWDRVMGARAPA